MAIPKNTGKSKREIVYLMHHVSDPFFDLLEKLILQVFKISRDEFYSPRRKKKYVVPRQVFYFFAAAYRNPTITLRNIGARFGQNHPNVNHSIKQVINLIETHDPVYGNKINFIGDVLNTMDNENYSRWPDKEWPFNDFKQKLLRKYYRPKPR